MVIESNLGRKGSNLRLQRSENSVLELSFRKIIPFDGADNLVLRNTDIKIRKKKIH
jgi:hypothetical protein